LFLHAVTCVHARDVLCNEDESQGERESLALVHQWMVAGSSLPSLSAVVPLMCRDPDIQQAIADDSCISHSLHK